MVITVLNSSINYLMVMTVKSLFRSNSSDKEQRPPIAARKERVAQTDYRTIILRGYQDFG